MDPGATVLCILFLHLVNTNSVTSLKRFTNFQQTTKGKKKRSKGEYLQTPQNESLQ